MFVYTRTRFRITLIGGNVTAQSTESQGNWRWNSNSRDVVASSPSFSCPPESLLAGYPARGKSCGRLFSKLNHCELIPTTVVICVNPFSPNSDQYQFSPYNINTFSGVKVQRIYKIIAEEEMLSSFIIFSSPNGSLKNDIVFSHFGQFSVALSFQKSIYYYFIINTTSCKTCFADIQEWAPWTFEWGGGNANVVYKDILEWIQQKLPWIVSKGHCHDVVILQIRPNSFRFFLSYLNLVIPEASISIKKPNSEGFWWKQDYLHDDVILLPIPESFRVLLSCANWDYCYKVI